MRVSFGRRYLFQSVHSLSGFREGRHGHHFFLEIQFLQDGLEFADSSYREFIEPKLHGRVLNDIIEPATGEKLAQWIFAELSRSPLGPHLLSVALQETEKNRFICSRSDKVYV